MNDKYNPDIHHRRSIRLKGYDYAQAGAYFVTICVHRKACLFGEIVHSEMTYNEPGLMILETLEQLPERFPVVEVDEYVLMPNHLHIIPVLADEQAESLPHAAALGGIMGAFKSITTNEYARGVRECGWKPFVGKLWQRNYHERIIRNERELDAIQQYIIYNPYHWEEDENYP